MDQDINESRENLGGRLELLEMLGDASRRNQAATDVFDETVGEFLGINRTDGRCLDIVERLGKVSAGQLANESKLTTGAVTAVIDRMERAGYVQRVRDDVDRRKVWVECTPETRAIVGQIFGFYDVVGPAMTGRFTTDQLRGILAFLEIGRLVQTEMAEGLREHLPDAAADAPERAAMAARFRKAMEAMAGRLQKMIEAVPMPGEERR
jgi:DNA-binding MarR family transcriptional regulator